MKRRLRKKLHKGEFQELCFEIGFDYAGESKDSIYSFEFFEEFDEYLDSIGLEPGVSIGEHYDGLICQLNCKEKLTPEKRETVIAWLNQHPDISNVVAGELRDAWYGWDKE